MWKNVLLLGANCPIGEAVATKLSQMANITKVNTAHSYFKDGLFTAKLNINENSQRNDFDKNHFDVVVNNVFASLNVQQWLEGDYKQEELMHLCSRANRVLHISPFPIKTGITLIPEALPWSSLAYRLSSFTTLLREYCRNEEVIAEAVASLINANEYSMSYTTVEKVLESNKNLQTEKTLLRGSFHVKSNYSLIDHRMLESQKLLSL